MYVCNIVEASGNWLNSKTYFGENPNSESENEQREKWMKNRRFDPKFVFWRKPLEEFTISAFILNEFRQKQLKAGKSEEQINLMINEDEKLILQKGKKKLDNVGTFFNPIRSTITFQTVEEQKKDLQAKVNVVNKLDLEYKKNKELYDMVKKVTERIGEIEALPKKTYFHHDLFGYNKDQLSQEKQQIYRKHFDDAENAQKQTKMYNFQVSVLNEGRYKSLEKESLESLNLQEYLLVEDLKEFKAKNPGISVGSVGVALKSINDNKVFLLSFVDHNVDHNKDEFALNTEQINQKPDESVSYHKKGSYCDKRGDFDEKGYYLGQYEQGGYFKNKAHELQKRIEEEKKTLNQAAKKNKNSSNGYSEDVLKKSIEDELKKGLKEKDLLNKNFQKVDDAVKEVYKSVSLAMDPVDKKISEFNKNIIKCKNICTLNIFNEDIENSVGVKVDNNGRAVEILTNEQCTTSVNPNLEDFNNIYLKDYVEYVKKENVRIEQGKELGNISKDYPKKTGRFDNFSQIFPFYWFDAHNKLFNFTDNKKITNSNANNKKIMDNNAKWDKGAKNKPFISDEAKQKIPYFLQ